MVEDLVVDLTLHKKLGITILSKADVANRRVDNSSVEWPQERPFNPPGVTLSEASYAMDQCKANNYCF